MVAATTASFEREYEHVRLTLVNLKNRCQAIISFTASNNAFVDELVQDTLNVLRNASTVLGNASAGVKAVADGIEGGGYSAATEWAVVKSAADDAIAWIGTNTPKTVLEGYVNAWVLTNAGVLTRRTVTPAQTAGLRTQLQAVVDTIG